MIYKNVTIYANAKQYSRWELNDKGEMINKEYTYNGYDFIEFQASFNDINLGEEVEVVSSAKTIKECKALIDVYIKNEGEIEV